MYHNIFFLIMQMLWHISIFIFIIKRSFKILK